MSKWDELKAEGEALKERGEQLEIQQRKYEKRIERLEAALRQIAAGAIQVRHIPGDDVVSEDYYIDIARKALESEDGE